MTYIEQNETSSERINVYWGYKPVSYQIISKDRNVIRFSINSREFGEVYRKSKICKIYRIRDRKMIRWYRRIKYFISAEGTLV